MMGSEPGSAGAVPGSSPPRRRKPSVQRAASSVLWRLGHPRHTLEFLRRFWRNGRVSQGADDPQLALYAEILPGGFLNYGYFDDPDTPPERLCLQDIEQAQVRYGRLLLEQVRDRQGAVLDAGCGMGGLVKLLLEAGCSPTALTPDRRQIAYLRQRYPQVPTIESRFETMPLEGSRRRFASVIMSESMQYMKLPRALPTVREILAPGGRWILCDYFRLRESGRRSGHLLPQFLAAVHAEGWRIVLQRDITAHALPTMRFLHMVGRRVGLPVFGFAEAKLRRRRPGLHYLLEHFLGEVRSFAEQQLGAIDPEAFRRERAYVLMVLERG